MSASPADATPKKRAKPRNWRDMRRQTDAASLGIEMVMAIALGAYLGYLFDGHFETGPWGMVFFVIAGIGAAFKAVLRVWRQTKGHLAASTRGVAELYAHPAPAQGGSRYASGRLSDGRTGGRSA